MMPAFAHIKMPSDMEERKTKFAEAIKLDIAKVLLDYMMDLIVLPYKYVLNFMFCLLWGVKAWEC